MRCRWLVGLVGVVGLAASAAPAAAQDPDTLSLSLGAFDFDDQEEVSAGARLEYRLGRKLFAEEFGPFFHGVGPMLGIMANSDGGVFGYGGLYLDLRVGERVQLVPTAGLGGYRQGDSRDLGGVFEFELGMSVLYALDNGDRAGLTFTHISNSSIHDRNPGVNTLLATYSVPLGRLL